MAATRGLASLHHLKTGGGVKSGVHVQVGSFSYPPQKKTLADWVCRWTIQMETFTHNEDTLTFTNRNGQGSETDVDLDVEAKGSF